ncbi:MAG TPA: hypothetical protein DCX95_07240, partial [Elusimicrobia bacterium]|nr:hypothetical protein [Elusimicrobiota bacterium]
MPPNGLLNRIKPDSSDVRKRFRRFFIAVIFVFIAVIISGEEKKLPIEEKLIYDVYWKFVKVGYGTLEIKGITDYRGKKAYHIYSEAKSAP